MPVDRRRLRQSIALTHDLAVRQRREPRMALADGVLNEAAEALERRRFQRDQKAPLARDDIENIVELSIWAGLIGAISIMSSP
jgi:hypothetical protein